MSNSALNENMEKITSEKRNNEKGYNNHHSLPETEPKEEEVDEFDDNGKAFR